MSLGRGLLGLIGVGTVLLGFSLAASVVRRRWFPGVAAPLRQLIDAVVTVAGILAVSLALGSVGWLRATPIVLVAVVVAVVASIVRFGSVPASGRESQAVARRSGRSGRAPEPERRDGRRTQRRCSMFAVTR